ncbi:MAG: helix-turn-helix transcriptional regulator [Acutalibacter sp.]|nr:helix-turn-helix transcriptional regulator [Acutalibacter sp.]
MGVLGRTLLFYSQLNPYPSSKNKLYMARPFWVILIPKGADFIGNQIGKNIHAFCKQQGLTQEKLAEQIRVSFQAVSKWENGSSMPDISVLPLLANVLHCSIDQLMGYVAVQKRLTDKDDFIVNRGIQHLWHIASANVLYLVHPGPSPTESSGVPGLHHHNLHRLVLFLQVLAHAYNGNASAYAHHKDVHFPLCVYPDFRASGGPAGGCGWRGVTNWPGMKLPEISIVSSSALAMAPFVPLPPSVSTSSAP